MTKFVTRNFINFARVAFVTGTLLGCRIVFCNGGHGPRYQKFCEPEHYPAF